jgi:poly(A) polymerase Pap1
MNSTFNALAMNVRIIKDEFRRAAELVSSAAALESDLNRVWAKLSESAISEGSWKLILPIHLRVAADDEVKENQRRRMFNWKGLIESKLRVLLLHLERIPGLIARPFPDPDVTESIDGDLECVYQVGLAMPPRRHHHPGVLIDLNEAVENFRSAVSIALTARADREDLKRHSRVTIAIH